MPAPVKYEYFTWMTSADICERRQYSRKMTVQRGRFRSPSPARQAPAGLRFADLAARRLTAAEDSPAWSPWAVFGANLARQVLGDRQLPPNLERFMAEDARLPIAAIVEEVLRLRLEQATLEWRKVAQALSLSL